MDSNKPIETFIDPEQLAQDVSLNEGGLDDALRNQASLYSHYADIYRKAQHQYDTAKNAVEIGSAKLNIKIREALQKEGEKITESLIDSRIKASNGYAELIRRKNEAAQILALCKSALEALTQKRDMLIQISSNMRHEMKGEIRVMEDANPRASGDAILNKIGN